MRMQHVVVLASNKEFRSQENSALNAISKVLWAELNAAQDIYNARVDAERKANLPKG